MARDVHDNPGMNRFEIDLDDGEKAVAVYNRLSNAIMFTHTEVPPGYEGQGLGRDLVVAALDAARHEGLKVIPVCTFFASYMKRHPETHDLLEPSYFKVLGID